ncbi:hypothetical protein [Ruegeria sp. PrR005]|uniref:Uncharacterized protein n=1 Tax=Ruegeria sp. PrR005 TaxID=2706882 RepID=A0A6B2NMP8_9RHOB|nr:hypothetical protein [Ruegeria sp. PrR005]NDW45392.1 hypothetical protein [Ruegeria sp. PrR005]
MSQITHEGISIMNFDKAIIEGLKNQLELEGYANDGQEFGVGHGSLGSTAFEHREADILADLRAIGYNGSLESAGRYFDGYGAIYWIFDPEIMDREEAEAQSKLWVQSSLKQSESQL